MFTIKEAYHKAYMWHRLYFSDHCPAYLEDDYERIRTLFHKYGYGLAWVYAEMSFRQSDAFS